MKGIKVGEYCKDIYGRIGKIYEYSHGTFKTKYFGASSGEIVKHSPNIIDLIEEGDYVNGEIVTRIKEWTSSKDGFFRYAVTVHYEIIRADEVKTIVTKEQFKSVEYIVEE